mmetsp:Transcript_33670/g.103923  ORF Transcript_33670/g.103923 Transcript_33670/m.103923 type:complete len:275 (+) Transcript_33670:300-1124(+)
MRGNQRWRHSRVSAHVSAPRTMSRGSPGGTSWHSTTMLSTRAAASAELSDAAMDASKPWPSMATSSIRCLGDTNRSTSLRATRATSIFVVAVAHLLRSPFIPFFLTCVRVHARICSDWLSSDEHSLSAAMWKMANGSAPLLTAAGIGTTRGATSAGRLATMARNTPCCGSNARRPASGCLRSRPSSAGTRLVPTSTNHFDTLGGARSCSSPFAAADGSSLPMVYVAPEEFMEMSSSDVAPSTNSARRARGVSGPCGGAAGDTTVVAGASVDIDS